VRLGSLARAIPVIVILVAIMVGVGAVYAQSIVSEVTITVEKDGKAVANVYVEVYNSNDTKVFSGYTNENGTITLSNITSGDYTVKVLYEDKLYIFNIKIDENTSEIKLDLSEFNWLKSNWKLLAIGAGAMFMLLLIMGVARRAF